MNRPAVLMLISGCLLLCACSPPAVSNPDHGNDNGGGAATSDPTADAPALRVSLGEDLVLAAGSLVEIAARVTSDPPDGRLLYLWGYSLDLSGKSKPRAIQPAIADDNTLVLDPATLFDAPDITFLLHVRVLQLLEGKGREAEAQVFVTLGDGPPPPGAAGLPDQALSVSLGPNLTGKPGDEFDIQAEISGAEPDGRLFYAWEFILDLGASSQTLSSSGFQPDRSSVHVDPLQLFSGPELEDGQTFVVRVRLFEIGAGGPREASDALFVSIGSGPLPIIIEDPGDPDGDAPDPDGNVNDNINDNANDNGNVNDNTNGNDNTNDNTNDNGGGSGECAGVTGFAVDLPDLIHMSLFEGTRRIQPTVCGGEAPHTYDWTPIDNLEDTGPLEGSASEITTEDVDFTPPATGDYDITVVVQDAAAASVDATVTIRVNDYDPLLALAGDDQVVTQGDPLSITGLGSGASGNYDFIWEPGGTTSATFTPPTGTVGETTYTLTVTDTETGAAADATMRVVVLPASGSSCSPLDVDLGLTTGRVVAYDAGFGSDGQALIASGQVLILYDFQTDTVRDNLVLPADIQDLAIDAVRRRAFATTRLDGQFTRSVQVIDLDNALLLDNIGLTDNVASARGLAVIPSTGEVLVAASGVTNGLMRVDPAGGTLVAALQNVHRPASFDQPIDVAVLEGGGLAVAVVVNASSSTLTLVPLADITQTPDVAGGGATLPRIALEGVGRAIVADPAAGQVIVGWNNGTAGRLQRVSVSGDDFGDPGPSTLLPGPVTDLAVDLNPTRREAYAALGTAGAGVVNIDFAVFVGALTGQPDSVLSVAATARDSVLLVGQGTDLSERCP